MDNLNCLEIGKRLKSLRAFLGLSRESFQQKFNISASTLRTWELPTHNRNGITLKGAKKIIDVLKNKQVQCSINWLLYGIGEFPQCHNKINRNMDDLLTSISNISSDDFKNAKSMLKDAESFRENNNNSAIVIISDDGMEPTYQMGDYVGGIYLEKEYFHQLISEICIIETDCGSTHVRRLERSNKLDSYHLISLNPKPSLSTPIYLDVKILKLAKIIWHRKQF